MSAPDVPGEGGGDEGLLVMRGEADASGEVTPRMLIRPDASEGWDRMVAGEEEEGGGKGGGAGAGGGMEGEREERAMEGGRPLSDVLVTKR